MDNINANKDLNTDKVVRALLMKRNILDPGCKLSPVEILFGRQLRDSLPRIEKHVDIFHNPQLSTSRRTAWKYKEEALKARYVKSMEHLNEHFQLLQPLKVGDNVLIQNQTGNRPNKWDHSEVVVEVKDYDQYLVKLSGNTFGSSDSNHREGNHTTIYKSRPYCCSPGSTNFHTGRDGDIRMPE